MAIQTRCSHTENGTRCIGYKGHDYGGAATQHTYAKAVTDRPQLLTQLGTNRLIAGLEWGASIYQTNDGYAVQLHTTDGKGSSWSSDVGAVDATTQEDAITEARRQLRALVNACLGPQED